ncbi:general transcription factor 3C polypeptide 3 [Homalodisca vitripennis]|uniref:general transcription factor 3C polypeptide 3 n=1 Tax=Homalodisca vitripennis TaxID=197043 RepID=UPI001EEB1D91|nr:general transcription factor 3C polypeptide 3 [Homalodisca vitripennis]XP_046661496.1 general transcription factor 3C polypeptide 3 [Homalodisca vitripennis]KAG8306544.1 General transcription factor IIIC, polypeptide 3 [Homalodisca vitripennis]
MDEENEEPIDSIPVENEINPLTEIDMDIDMPSTSEDYSLTTLQSVIPVSVTEEDSGSDDEQTVVKRTKEEVQDLTNKYLTGELTFSEYAAQYGENVYEEAYEEDEPEKKQEQETSAEANDFEQNLAEIKESSSTKKRPKIRSRQRNNLPPVLKGLMGEANLRYVHGEHELAIKLCFEIIRQFPWASQPFETLASLYDEKGDTEKSLQISLLAAHLNPRASKHLWINLAERSEDRGDLKQAITCYGKAIRADSKDFELHMKQAILYERTDDKKSALKRYSKLLQCVGPQHGEKLVEIAKMLAHRYHEGNDLPKAKEALKTLFEKCPNLVTIELVNFMLEILISLKDFETSIETLVKFCNLQATFDKTEDSKFRLLTCSEPENMVVDIFAKLVIIVIHSQAFHLFDHFLTKVKTMNPEEAGDFYFDVAEALIAEKRFKDAMELLTPLTQSTNFNLPAIWLRMAECLKALDRIEDSIKAYLIVVDKAPQLLGARLAVSELLISLGRRDKALEVLTQDEDSEVLNTALLYERCLLLQKMPDKKEQFLVVANLFLSRHFVHIAAKEDITALTTSKAERKKSMIKENKNFQKSFSQGEELKGEFSQTFNEPASEDEWQLFWSVCEVCLEIGNYSTLQRLAFSAQGSPKFSKYSNQIDLLCLSACYYNSDAYFGYNMVRAQVMKNMDCKRSWNLFNMMILRADDSRHNRFLMRLLIRNPHHRALTTLHANNCLVAGTYKYALSDYTAVYQKENSAMMAFLIGVTLCQMACQKFSAKKHSLVTQSVAYFWKYKELRGREGLQESHFNIARAFHQLGLLPSAIHHYKKALEAKSKFIDDNAEHLNLQREAAFNLHLIYLSSGTRDVARMYLEKYIVI